MQRSNETHQLAVTLALMAMMALSGLLLGCRQQEVERPSEPQPQQVLHLDLLGALESPKAMGYQIHSSSETAELSYLPIETPTVHCFLRRAGAGNKVYHFAVTPEHWAMQSSPRETNRYQMTTRDDAQVTIPGEGLDLTSGEWLFTAFLGGHYDEVTKELRYTPEESYDDHLFAGQAKIDIPYSTHWRRITVENRGTAGHPSLWLQQRDLIFSPMGMLIRVRLFSDMEAEEGSQAPGPRQTIEVGQLALVTESSDFCSDVTFDPSHAQEGARPRMKNTFPERSVFPYRVHSRISSASSQMKTGHGGAPVALLWGINIAEDQTRPVTFRISALGYKLRAMNPSPRVKQGDYSVQVTRPMAHGKSGYINVSLVRPKTPLEYVADANLSPTPRRLADPNDSFHSGYFDLSDIYAETDWEQRHLPDGMYLPRVEEWQTLFPGTMSPQYIRFNGAYPTQTCIDRMSLAGQTYTAKSEYMGVDRGNDRYEVYALCFQPTTGTPILGTETLGTRRFLTAIRYEFGKTGDFTEPKVPKAQENPEGYTLRVTSYYIGNDPAYKDLTLAELANAPQLGGKSAHGGKRLVGSSLNKKFFVDADPEGRRRIVYLPMTGYGKRDGGLSAKQINIDLGGKTGEGLQQAHQTLVGRGSLTDNRLGENADSYYVLKGTDESGYYWHLVLNRQNGIGRGPKYPGETTWDQAHYPAVRPFVRFAR